ncbi:hypothetical protein [Endozoicomonas arenosclerae]|uniref:hypothetical protein n=1 Tax=Endozoicomonas arenosclerae TaxID=1633495 RepID=UPI00078126F4|nr:hypothetical protein [Endozoicomonas arenosclerae]
MSLEGVKSFVASHLSLTGLKSDCEKLYGVVFGKLVHVLEALTTALDKVSGSAGSELSFNQSVHKRKASPWKVAVKLHNWHLERYEEKARSLMTSALEKLVDRGTNIQDLSSEEAKSLASELMEDLLELDDSVFRALSIAKGKKPGPEDMGKAMRDLFDEVDKGDDEKLKTLLREKGFLYKFIRASAQLNVIKASVKTDSEVEAQPLAINCLGVRACNFLHNTLELYYEMTDSLLPDEKTSLQKQIDAVSASENDLLPLSQAVFNRLYSED